MMRIIVFNICHHFHDDDGHRHNSALMAWAFRARCRLIKGLKTWCGHDTLYLHLAHCIVFVSTQLHCSCICSTVLYLHLAQCIVFVLFATGLRCLVMYMHSNMICNVRNLYPPGLCFNVFSKYCIFTANTIKCVANVFFHVSECLRMFPAITLYWKTCCDTLFLHSLSTASAVVHNEKFGGARIRITRAPLLTPPYPAT